MKSTEADGGYEINVWVDQADTEFPSRESPLRFAVGTPSGPSSNSWRLWLHNESVYVKCRDNFGDVKASLHASGVWRFGFTKEAASAATGLVPANRDRALTKWRPKLDSDEGFHTGFQIVVLPGGLYLGPARRKEWPSTVTFIEPPASPDMMTVVSVVLAETTKPLRIAPGTHGGVVSVMPLEEGRTVQVIATHEDTGTMEDAIRDSLATVARKAKDIMPETGVLLVHGRRDEGTMWLCAVKFEKIDG